MSATLWDCRDAVTISDRLVAAHNGDVLKAYLVARSPSLGRTAAVLDPVDDLLWDRMDAGQRALTGAPLPSVEQVAEARSRAQWSARKHAGVTVPEWIEECAA